MEPLGTQQSQRPPQLVLGHLPRVGLEHSVLVSTISNKHPVYCRTCPELLIRRMDISSSCVSQSTYLIIYLNDLSAHPPVQCKWQS